MSNSSSDGYLIDSLSLFFFPSRFVAFDNVHVPRECLMNKDSYVTADGQYVSSIKDPRKRFAATLGALSQGRIGITEMCVVNLRLCLTIAIRFVFFNYDL